MPIKERMNFLDSARAAVLLLGIPYHAALIFSPSANWIVNSTHKSEMLGIFVHASHIFRMPTFFIIAGYFVGLGLSKAPYSKWISHRLPRLLFPLISALLIITPIQIFIQLATHNYAGLWLYHLWFLVVISLYSCLSTSTIQRAASIAALQFSQRPIMSLIVFSAASSIYVTLITVIHAIFSINILGLPVFQFLVFIPYYFLGLILFSSHSLWHRMTSMPAYWSLASIALCTFIAFFPGEHSLIKLFRVLASSFIATFTSIALLSLFKRFMNNDNKYVRWISQSSLYVYLWHHPVILISYLCLSPLIPGTWALFYSICAVTAAASIAIALMTRKSSFLSFIFSGAKTPPNPQVKAGIEAKSK